jgi:hypothetical protein
VLCFERGSLFQIDVAILIAAFYTIAIAKIKPYQLETDNTLAMCTESILFLCFVTGFLLKVEFGFLPLGCYELGYTADQVGLVFVGLVSAAVIMTVICTIYDMQTANKEPIMRYKYDHSIVTLPSKPSGHYHIFISHAQMDGGDQVAVLKGLLEKYCKTVEVFTDVAAGRQEKGLELLLDLDKIVSNVDVMVCFLTKKYWTRYWCIKEVKIAEDAKKPVVMVRETDERHGGGSLEKMAENARTASGSNEHFSFVYADGAPLYEWLKGHLPPHGAPWQDTNQTIGWFRDAHMKKISLKMIMQRVVLTIANAGVMEIPALINKGITTEQAIDRYCRGRSAAENESEKDEDDQDFGVLLRIPAEITASRPWLPALVNSPFSYDLFLSAHHPSSKTLKAKLERWVVGIQIYLPEYPAQGEEKLIARCRAMVVVLDDGRTGRRMSTDGIPAASNILTSAEYREDVKVGLEQSTADANGPRLAVILLHILPSEFETFRVNAETRQLAQNGLFNSIAVPCLSGLANLIAENNDEISEYDMVSIARLLQKMPEIEGAKQRRADSRRKPQATEQRGGRANTIDTVYKNADYSGGAAFQSNPAFDSGTRAQLQQDTIPPWKKKAQAAQANRDGGGGSAGGGVVAQVPRWKQKAFAKGYTDGGAGWHKGRAVSSSNQGDLPEFNQVAL